MTSPPPQSAATSLRQRLSPAHHPVRVYLAVVAVPLVYTAMLVDPRWHVTWFSAQARVLTATSGFWLALMAALTLHLPDRDRYDYARNAFVAALLALAVAHAVMLFGFVLVPGSDNREVAAVYGWLVARYLSGLLFITVALGRPRLTVQRWSAVIVGAVAVAIALCFPLASWLPHPFATTTQGIAVVRSTPGVSLIVSALPAGLYAVGAFLSWRRFKVRGDLMYFWLSLALLLQVLSKVHELVYSASFGPILTSADVLVAGMLALLLAVGLSSIRSLSRDRANALAAQEQDLRTQSQLLGAMASFTEREELFRSIVTHDVATPIAALRAYAHVAQNPKSSTDQIRSAAQGINEQSRRLSELVGRMEELRTLESDDVEVALRPVALAPLLEEGARFGRALASGHSIAVVCDPIVVLVDPLRFGQALRNLISNAVRYSPPGSLIVLESERAADAMVEVAVTNDGPGIPLLERRRLMEKYERGRDEPAGGSGLGLYIARRIAEAHGGALHLADGERGGTRAVIELREAT